MKRYAFLFFVVILIACLTQIASDIYAPALTNIAAELEARLDSMQWSIGAYMISIALSQLVYGPVAECIGRKKPLIVGLIIMLMGSIVSAFASSSHMLILGRVIQGCGAGAAATLWRAIFRDVFSGEELSKYTSYLIIFIIFVVPAAPILGSYLQDLLGWRACFGFMALYICLTLGVIWSGFEDTSKYHHIKKFQILYIMRTYKQLVTHRLFVGITLCTFLTYGVFFSWFVVGPVLMIKNLKMTPVQYAWVSFLSALLSNASGAVVNTLFVKKWGMPNMMRMGWAIMLVGGAGLLLTLKIVGFTLLSLMIPITVFYFGSAIIWPNAFATAFTPFGKVAGYAGALYGAMQLAGGDIVSSVAAYISHDSPFSFGFLMVIAALLSWILYETIAANQKVESDS